MKKRMIIVLTAFLFTAILCPPILSAATDRTADLLALTGYGEPLYSQQYEHWLNQGITDAVDLTPIVIPAYEVRAWSHDELFRIQENCLVWEGDGGWVEYEVTIDHPGLYNIAIEYLPIGNHIFNIERACRLMEVSVLGSSANDLPSTMAQSRVSFPARRVW